MVEVVVVVVVVVLGGVMRLIDIEADEEDKDGELVGRNTQELLEDATSSSRWRQRCIVVVVVVEMAVSA